ncbi:hypothetical protein C8J56DRAFT_888962 [Mycena floridula]|nr:hypothetical protein C8J56DRAFT_888962 [Mycena floridula]
MVAPSKLAKSNDKELFRAFFLHEIDQDRFHSKYDHANWGTEVGFEVIVPGLLARFYSSTGRGVLIPRDLFVLYRQYCRNIRGDSFDARGGPIGFDYFANLLIHCDKVPGMLAIRNSQDDQNYIYGVNLPELDLDQIYGPRPMPQVAPCMTEKREKLLNDLLAERAARDLHFQEKRALEKAAAAKNNNKRGANFNSDDVFADTFVAPSKKQKKSHGKGKSPDSHQTDKCSKHSNSKSASPIVKAHIGGKSSKREAHRAGKSTSNKTATPTRNISPPLAENTSAYENQSPFNRDNENSGSGTAAGHEDDLWTEGEELLPFKPDSWSKADWKRYCFAHSDRIREEMDAELDEFLKSGENGEQVEEDQVGEGNEMDVEHD